MRGSYRGDILVKVLLGFIYYFYYHVDTKPHRAQCEDAAGPFKCAPGWPFGPRRREWGLHINTHGSYLLAGRPKILGIL